MSNPVTEGVNTTETTDKPHSLTGHVPRNVNSTGSSLSCPIASKVVARQIKGATDPLAKQLERLCDLMKELRRSPPKRSEETSGLIQGLSRAPSYRFDKGLVQWGS